jgi:hypothetical protein
MKKVLFLGVISLFVSCQSDNTKLLNTLEKLIDVQGKANAIARERNQLIKDGLKLQETVHKEKLDTSEIYTRIYTN